MNQAAMLLLLAGLCVGFAFLWDATRSKLAEVRADYEQLEKTRAADNAALSALQAELAASRQRYDTLTKELRELNDGPALDYFGTPVPDSVRRLLER